MMNILIDVVHLKKHSQDILECKKMRFLQWYGTSIFAILSESVMEVKQDLMVLSIKKTP